MMNKPKAFKLQEFVAHGGTRVESLRLGRRSGRVLVTGGEDKRVNVWAIGKPNAVMSLSGLSSSVASVAFDSHEEVIAAGSVGGTIKLWDLDEKKVVRTFPGHNTSCVTVDFHPIGQYLASGSHDTQIKIWDIRRKGCIQTYKEHNRGVSIVRFSPDGRLLISGGEDGVVKVWDIIAGKLLCDFEHHHTGPVVSLDFHPNEFLMASGSADGAVAFWDVETFEMVSNATLGPVAGGDGRYGGVRSIAFIPSGQALLAAYRSSLCAWKWEPTATPLDTISADWSDVMDMAIVNDQLIACTIREAQVGIWMVNMQKINLGGSHASTAPPHAPHKPSTASSFRLQGGPPDSPGHPDFQVNSARSALKANNGLSQYKSIDLPPTNNNDDDNNNSISSEDIITSPPPPTKPTTPPPPAAAVATPPLAASTPSPTPPSSSSSSSTTAKSTPAPSKPKQTKQPAPTTPPPVIIEKPTTTDRDTPSTILPIFQRGGGGDIQDPKELEFLSLVVEKHDATMSTLNKRLDHHKEIKSLWSENGSGNDSKGVLIVLGKVAQVEDSQVMVDFLRMLPLRDDFFTLDLCTALLPIMIDLLNHTQQEEYLYQGLSITQRLVKLFGNLIKTTREAPTAKGVVDLSKEERMEKCQSCYNNLITIQHLIAPLARRSGTMSKNAKDLSNLLRLYIPDVS